LAGFCRSPPSASYQAQPVSRERQEDHPQIKDEKQRRKIDYKRQARAWISRGVFPLVFQSKLKNKFISNNQCQRMPIQITPAHHFNEKRRPWTSFFVPEIQEMQGFSA
jgi:hypothetical protein